MSRLTTGLTPLSIETRDQDPGTFPVDAFEFDGPGSSVGSGKYIRPRAGWNMGLAREGSSVTTWSSTKTYSTAGERVTVGGVQFSCLVTTGNTGKNPLSNPTYWIASPMPMELIQLANSGRVIIGDMHPVHNYNGSGYAQFFNLGAFVIGGLSCTFYGVHLDGSAVGSGALSTIVEQWYLKDTLAPGSTGSRTLVDARERVLRAMGATGGKAATLGAVQEDQMQGHKHMEMYPTGASPATGGLTNTTNAYAGSYGDTNVFTATPSTDGTNGTPRIGTETRVKGLVVGVPYVVLLYYV